MELKGIEYEYRAVNLLESEQDQAEYKDVNPQGLVPTLLMDGHTFGQSLSIIEYLEETYPNPPLLPKDPIKRADVRCLALMITADIQSVQKRKSSKICWR